MKFRQNAMTLLALSALSCSADEPDRIRRSSEPLPIGVQQMETTGLPGGTLKYALLGEPRSFNPLAVTDIRTLVVTTLTQSTILDWPSAAPEARPGVASEWRVFDDGKAVELTLREGLRFSDGTPLSIDDLVFSLEAIIAPESNNSLKSDILFEGQTWSIEKTGEMAVTIRLAQPDSELEYTLSRLPVLPKSRLGSAFPTVEKAWNLQTPTQEVSGLGPFRILRHEPGRQTILERNPHYWRIDRDNVRLPYLDQIEIRYITDVNSQVLRLQTGDIDLIDQVLDPESFRMLAQSEEGLQVVNAGPSANTSLLWFNLNQGRDDKNQLYLPNPKRRWFLDQRFRQAIDLAINRQEIVRTVLLGQATATRSIVPPWSDYSDKEFGDFERNLDEARQILAKAGYTKRGEQLVDSRGIPVGFELLTIPTLADSAQIIQKDLSELGISISLRQQEMRAVGAAVLSSRRYDAVLASFQLSGRPSDLSNFLPSSGQMHVWSPMQQSAETEWEGLVDTLMADLRVTREDRQRVDAFRRVQSILAEQRPILPVMFRNRLIAHRTSVRNLRPDPRSGIPGLWNAWELFISSE